MQTGDQFKISSVRKVLTDPETNEILGLVESDLGLAEAVSVDLKYTRARMLGAFHPAVGDIVRFAHKEDNESATAFPQGREAGYKVME